MLLTNPNNAIVQQLLYYIAADMKRKQSYEFGDCLSGDEQGDETSYDDDDNDDNVVD